MISRSINNLLKSEKRVTVPALGSFMKRGDGVIVFTDMFKENDGVLIQHIASQMSITPSEAADDIRKFVEQVMQNLSTRGIAELSDMGILSRNDNGSIVFIHKSEVEKITPKESVDAEPESHTNDAEPTNIPETPIQERSEINPIEQDTAVVTDTTESEQNANDITNIELSEQIPTQPKERATELQAENTPKGEVQSETIAPVPTPTSSRKNKDGELFDKLMAADTPQPKVKTQPATIKSAQNTQATQTQEPAYQPGTPKRKIDWVMIIAITSAVIALLCLAFGLLEGSATTVTI